MIVEITNGIHLGRRTYGFEIRQSRGGPVIDSGRGFAYEATLNDAVAVAKRRVAGVRPRAPNAADITETTAGVISEFVKQQWPITQTV